MSKYTPIERSDIVELYIENQKSIVRTQRAFRRKFPRQKPPDPKTIRTLYSKFISTGNLNDVLRLTIHRRARCNVNIALVRDDVARNPNFSIARRATSLGLSYASLKRILRE